MTNQQFLKLKNELGTITMQEVNNLHATENKSGDQKIIAEKVNDKIIEAIHSWTALQRGKEISGARIETIYSFMDSTRIKRGYGTFKGSRAEMYSIDHLINSFDLRKYIK